MPKRDVLKGEITNNRIGQQKPYRIQKWVLYGFLRLIRCLGANTLKKRTRPFGFHQKDVSAFFNPSKVFGKGDGENPFFKKVFPDNSINDLITCSPLRSQQQPPHVIWNDGCYHSHRSKSVFLLRSFLNSNCNSNSHTNHGVVTCADETHHLFA